MLIIKIQTDHVMVKTQWYAAPN